MVSLTLTDLPDEIIDEIAQRTTLCELKLLLRVGNRAVYNICIPYLYRDVTVCTATTLCSFCEAVNSHPAFATRVKILRILIPSFSAAMQWEPRVTACATAIARLTALETLEVHTRRLLSHLPSDAFPHLRRFVAPFFGGLVPFLLAHARLQELAIGEQHLQCGDLRLPTIHLPELRAFYGPAMLAGVIIPSPPAERISAMDAK
ncbi:hypothetical protein FB45DRAFT_1085926 [Roridomyces roridus]|uniref:F-box domain-containing protein n=1 Tax=Roridomyces roridus TaxID=1738132 RepID=A0AAD7BKY6_9AGAR|nr:hypothetical protein FB45DRAFT_1085926 [Roridomyces roridus]